MGKHILVIDLSRPDPIIKHIQEIKTDNKKLPIEILRRRWHRLIFDPEKIKKLLAHMCTVSGDKIRKGDHIRQFVAKVGDFRATKIA